MNTRLNDPAGDFCWCDDAELDRVRALMAAGMGQVAASLVVWGSPMADLHAWTEERTRARFPWWRLSNDMSEED